jgi:hypothetical protein
MLQNISIQILVNIRQAKVTILDFKIGLFENLEKNRK